MDDRIRNLIERSFPAAAERPPAVEACLTQLARGETLAGETLTALLALALERHQSCVADRVRQAAERLEAEAQTENLLQLLGTILESSDEGILALDVDDRIIRFNSQLVSLFRIPDEVIAFWRHEEVMAAVLAQLSEPQAFSDSLARLCGQADANWRETLECLDGRVIEWRSQPQPAVWAGVKRVVSFLDVTERFRSETHRRLLERKLDETQGRLLQAEKLAAIFQLSAGLAHEISNPIGFVQSNLEALRRYVGSMLDLLDRYRRGESGMSPESPLLAEIAAAKQAMDFDFLRQDTLDLLDESLKGTGRLATMVASLRVLAHAQGSGSRRAALQEMLDAAWARIAPLAGERIRFLPVYAGVPELECRPSELAEVFKNLLTNAVEAIDGVGSVGIRTGVGGDEAWVDIVDTGRGIAPENLSRIFDPFFTTKPPGAGMGLGLSVAYAIVSIHGGTIGAFSQPGQGSRFRVTLPLRQPAAG
ncbi:sensor histidine kinase [Azonexus sp. R2A61]|uniref:sensor histidine kinase n=1 Tax=Azonexus sp. R2A61 TaxID=2744443 RepID=UPI001F31E8B6|nr:ATP-binding protein [Azonexus sp. R2A61]